jgi:regulator of sigma E protease
VLHAAADYGLQAWKKTPLRVIRQAWNYRALLCAHRDLSTLVDLARGRESINDLSGPVGIVSAIGQAASHRLADAVQLPRAALRSTSASINLLPLPALDGGKLVFLAASRAWSGRPVSARKCRITVNVDRLRAAVRADDLCDVSMTSPGWLAGQLG